MTRPAASRFGHPEGRPLPNRTNDAEGITPQSMGAIIATLEAAGVVERKPHPTDGRQMHIAVTAKGLALRKSRQNAKETWLGRAIGQLDKEDQATLFAAAEIVKRLVEL